MASDINRATIIGRLTRDPELKYIQGGSAVANLSIASNRSYTTSSGEKREEVSYFDCVAWGKLGEIIVEYTSKGRRIAIEGRLQQRRWEDQNSNKRSKIEIVVENFQFLDSKPGSEQNITNDSPAEVVNVNAGESNTSAPAEANNPFSDNDIPF